jgi:hypothetical protein
MGEIKKENNAMFRIKTLFGMATATALVYLCLIVAPLSAQTEDLDQPPDPTHKGIPRLESVLSELLDMFEKGGIGRAIAFAKKRGIEISAGRIRVRAEMESEEQAKRFRLPGVKVETTHRNLVRLLVPLGRIRALVAAPGVKFVREPLKPLSLAGGVTSEGVAITGADTWHDSGLTGDGVKVAILDCDGFADYQDLLGNELPPADRVVVQSFRWDGDIEAGVHGTACAEVVYDMSPGATLYLVNYADEVGMFQAILWLINQGVDVITHSCGWVNIGPYDGTGGICETVNMAHDEGIFWANSIGNQAERHWEGYFKDKDRDSWHDFDRRDETIDISASGGDTIYVFLSWNDWGPLWPLVSGGSTHDYDLYLLDSGLNVVASSLNYQNGSSDPIEGITYSVPASGTYHVAVHNYAASGDHHLEIYSFRQNLEHQVPESSLMIPADTTGAVAAGAAHWNSQSLEYFSSWGPPDREGGGPPDYNYPRYKPELLSPDDVSNFTYSGGFRGTSASSPHVAGTAALLLSPNSPYSGSTPDQLRAVLTENATNNGYGSLPNWEHGYGFLTMPTLEGNNPPVAVDDEYSITENTTLDVPAPGVLGNDSDPNDDPLAASLVTNPANGTLSSFLPDGSFTYTPNLDFTGTDSFTYKANDSFVDSNEATVSITINTAGTMHVESIELSVKTKGPKCEAVAEVKILDKNGEPVSRAEVFGAFSGTQIGESPESNSQTTNKQGIAKLKIERPGQITSFEFCVDDVIHSSYLYNPAVNVETCDVK